MPQNNSRTVWSSDQGDLRGKESGTVNPKSLPPHEQTAYLHRDSKSRGGKMVTIIKKLVLSDVDMKELAKRLKQVCGTGGTVKDGEIEIQGEHREKIAQELKKLGYKVKVAGG